MNCCPKVAERRSATVRAMMSAACPGGKGTMILTGLVGHCWAAADPQTSSNATKTYPKHLMNDLRNALRVAAGGHFWTGTATIVFVAARLATEYNALYAGSHRPAR